MPHNEAEPRPTVTFPPTRTGVIQARPRLNEISRKHWLCMKVNTWTYCTCNSISTPIKGGQSTYGRKLKMWLFSKWWGGTRSRRGTACRVVSLYCRDPKLEPRVVHRYRLLVVQHLRLLRTSTKPPKIISSSCHSLQVRTLEAVKVCKKPHELICRCLIQNPNQGVPLAASHESTANTRSLSCSSLHRRRYTLYFH